MQKKDKIICRLKSPAKINRFMRIVDRDKNGMHQLQTLFQFIDLEDELVFYSNSSTNTKISTNLEHIGGKENIVLKAAKLLLQNADAKYKKPTGAYAEFGIHIEIQKKIPTGAGLGGGSSNAATCLLALNKIWQLDFNSSELENIGKNLGADVPIFIRGKSAFAEGVGDLFTDAQNINQPILLLVYPGLGCNTGEVFQNAQLSRKNPPINLSTLQNSNCEIPKFNDALEVARKINPSLNEAWQWLEKYGQAQLTGTGACIFLECNTDETARNIAKKIPKKFAGYSTKSFVVQTLNSTKLKKDLNNCV